MPGMSLSTGSKDGKVFENQIGHGIVTEDGQARIDTAIIGTRAAKPGAAFSCTATEYINEIDQHRPKTLPSAQQRAETMLSTRRACSSRRRSRYRLPPRTITARAGRLQTRCRATRVHKTASVTVTAVTHDHSWSQVKAATRASLSGFQLTIPRLP
jgi:hypothetical protein